jgi:Mor family transcriptional regulator
MDRKLEIAEYIKNNPILKQSEIASHFGIKRRYVSLILGSELTDGEREKLKIAKVEYYREKLIPMISDGSSFVDMVKELRISEGKLRRIISNDKILSVAVDHKQAENRAREQELIFDWNRGAHIFDLMKKYNLGKTQVNAFSKMSKIRAKYGKDKVSLRLDNSKVVLEKYKKFLEYTKQGFSKEEIAKLLGYKNANSLAGSMPRAKEIFDRQS